ncbi:MMPL family transporter [Leifsonia lichenia]
MPSVLYSLGRWAFRARGRVLAFWAAVIVVFFATAGLLSTGTDNTYTIPGTESQQALDALARTFPQVSGTSAQLVVVAPAGADVRDASIQPLVESAVAAIGEVPQVSSATSPYGSSSTTNISSDGAAALAPIQLSVAQSQVLDSTKDSLQAEGRKLAASLPHGSQVAVGGQLFAQTDTGISVTELLGIAVAFVVLVFTFASFVAAGLPLVTALLGAGLSLSLIFVATRFTTITSTTPLLALMLGLAVGIDYALFIISRHQDQLEHGVEPEESAARAVATAGSAVVFAAMTVIIALLGLSVAGIPFLTTMGVAAALAVGMAVVISMTLTPALLGFAGMRVVAKRYRGVREGAGVEVADEPVTRGFFLGWVRTATKWPIVTVLAVVALLGLATVPAAQLRLALPDAGSLDTHEPARIAYDLIGTHFGPGYNGPLVVTGQIIQSTDPVELMDELATEIRSVPGVAAVPLSTPNQPGDTGIVQVIPVGGPDSEQTKDLVAALRGMHEHFLAEYGVDLSVTGYTAAGIDISARLGQALLPFALVVVGLSLVLLAMVFRSIVVPVTAALGYLLSVGAAFGVTSLVFESGFLAGPLGVSSLGSVISFMPIILMGVLFGLAMDYEVFLVSRMREDYVHHGAARRAVEQGFVGSARVVTAAALIMFAVFAAFIPDGDASIQPIALGLAVGVLIDAFVVRMTLIPAVLVLFGDRAWWMPVWLDRALPSFDVEGEALQEELAAADWPEPGERIAIAASEVAVGRPWRPVVSGIDAVVPAGDALVVCGGTASARTAVLLALAGRARVGGGRLKVAGYVLPAKSAAVRRAVGVARLGGGGAGAVDAGGVDAGGVDAGGVDADGVDADGVDADGVDADGGGGMNAAAAVRAALQGGVRVLVVDDVDAVRWPSERAAVANVLRRAGRRRAETVGTVREDAVREDGAGPAHPLTIVVSCMEADGADDVLPGGMKRFVLDLDARGGSSTAPATPATPAAEPERELI